MFRKIRISSIKPGMRLVCWALIGLTLAFGATQVARACTAFAMECQDGLLFGANFDNDFRPGLLFVNKRGVSKSGFPMDESETPAAWTSKYGSVTFHTAPYQYAWAGMNEAGLVISTMQLDDTQVPPPDARPSLLSAAWVQYVLDTCATIQDIMAAERRVRLNFGVDHYLACDVTGQCLAVEFLAGKPVYHHGKDLPIKAMTAGWPYSQSIKRQRGAAAPSPLAGGLPRVDKMLRDRRPEDADGGVKYAFRILKAVSADNTTWSLVFDLDRKSVFFRSYRNERVRHLTFSDLDFSCRSPVTMLDVHAQLAGDLTGHLQEFSSETVLQHALESVAFHRPDMPEDVVRQILRHHEQYICTDAD